MIKQLFIFINLNYIKQEKVEVEEEKEKVEEEEEFHSDVSIEDEEYIPPGGLFVPGLYTPPNELAKANGLSYFYPKVNFILQYCRHAVAALK